jgi:hypothetical protein
MASSSLFETTSRGVFTAEQLWPSRGQTTNSQLKGGHPSPLFIGTLPLDFGGLKLAVIQGQIPHLWIADYIDSYYCLSESGHSYKGCQPCGVNYKVIQRKVIRQQCQRLVYIHRSNGIRLQK